MLEITDRSQPEYPAENQGMVLFNLFKCRVIHEHGLSPSLHTLRHADPENMNRLVIGLRANG